MNNSQILDALIKANTNLRYCKPYVAKLNSLCTFTKELQKISGFKYELKPIKGNVELVRELPELLPENYKENFWKAKTAQSNLIDLYGEFPLWQPVTLSHEAGTYNFNLPIDNLFFNYYLTLLGEVVLETKKEETEKLKVITVPEVIECIKKAAKFMSKDELRQAMQTVCLDFSEPGLQIIATDAHRLYYSPLMPVNLSIDNGLLTVKKFKPFQLLIYHTSLKELVKSKVKGKELCIKVYEGKANINGIDVELLDSRFPDFRCVIPVYKTSILFDRELFIKNVKKVKPYANKSTEQVTLHLNGSIAMNAQDVDFSFECNADMPYVTKEFEDTDIAFNGSFLNDALSIFKEKNVKMYTEGCNTKAAIFSNDTDNVLVMPLMLNN